MRIGILGKGRIAKTLTALWTSKHDVVTGGRDELLEPAVHGEVVVLAIPYAAIETLDAAVKQALAGKLVIDCANPFANRDGAIAEKVAESGRGSGVFTASFLPQARIVKAFNTVHFEVMASPRAENERVAVPLAGAAGDVAVVAELVRDAGLEPVECGPLEAAALFEPGTEVWNSSMTAPELRHALFRRDEPDGEIVIYQSPVIDESVFFHGFPERTGGLSKAARSSLNVGYRWGDDRAVVEDNRRLVAEHVGYPASALIVTKHVHGNAVWTVGEPMPEPPEFDGLVADHAGVVLAAFAADCVPIVFGDAQARVCGAVHAGWRGTVSRAARHVVDAMVAKGAAPERIRVALGPCIGSCCFEVGPEVVEAFREEFGDVPGLVVDGPRKEHIDLRVANRFQLEECGVAPENIDSAPPCTQCHPTRFFSYRRDGFMGGVHMGFIGLRDA